MENSLCFGGFVDRCRGLRRVVTDRATFANLADVFVLPAYRRRGLAKELLRVVLAHPDLQRVASVHWRRATRTASTVGSASRRHSPAVPDGTLLPAITSIRASSPRVRSAPDPTHEARINDRGSAADSDRGSVRDWCPCAWSEGRSTDVSRLALANSPNLRVHAVCRPNLQGASSNYFESIAAGLSGVHPITARC